MPTLTAPRTAIIGLVQALKGLDLSDTSVNSVTWVHGVARNVKLTSGLLAEWKAKTDVINSEAYSKYLTAKEALGPEADASALDEEYKEVLADRQTLIEAAEKWLNEEIDHEIFSWPLAAVPESIDRKFLVALTDWIRD